MITIKRTLTQNEKDALIITGLTEQDIIDYSLRVTNDYIEYIIGQAIHKKLKDKTLDQITAILETP